MKHPINNVSKTILKLIKSLQEEENKKIKELNQKYLLSEEEESLDIYLDMMENPIINRTSTKLITDYFEEYLWFLGSQYQEKFNFIKRGLKNLTEQILKNKKVFDKNIELDKNWEKVWSKLLILLMTKPADYVGDKSSLGEDKEKD